MLAVMVNDLFRNQVRSGSIPDVSTSTTYYAGVARQARPLICIQVNAGANPVSSSDMYS